MGLDDMLELLASLGNAALHMLTQPFYYIALLFIILYCRRQTLLERRLIHVKLHSWGREVWRAIGTGLAAGVLVSLAAMLLGVSASGPAVVCIWAVSLILLLLRVRYFCFAYSIGLLGVVQAVLSFFPAFRPGGLGGEAVTAVREMDIPALLALAAVLLVVEALLVRWQGPRLATPLFLEGKRGRVVGGYRVEAFWPLPLFLLIPAGAGTGALPWPTLLGGGLGLVSLPVVIGFSQLTTGMLPRRKSARASGRLLLCGAVLLGLALLAARYSPLTLLAALAALLLHEGLVWYGALEERRSSPFFVHPPHGLKVLAVLPGSPAQELGILPGEILLKVNGEALTGKAQQLHEALRKSPAFCKLEVQNAAGESKYLQRAIYDGDHHLLGVILAPQPDEDTTAPEQPAGIAGIVLMKTGARRRQPGDAAVPPRRETAASQETAASEEAAPALPAPGAPGPLPGPSRAKSAKG
ncbi:PDZ domain-containing protein [Paenibacillus forsythiae]|uniref:PDZ domain-containing protein n=1 Tax=Paenibacillus forsythiae TaxID=365616 RepID=UPI0035DE2437